MSKVQDYKELIENILKTPLEIYQMESSFNFQRRKAFTTTIENLLKLVNESDLLYEKTGINLTEWENKYFLVIEQLLELCFGVEIASSIQTYIYSALENEQPYVEYTMRDNSIVVVETVGDLYDFVMRLISGEDPENTLN